MKKKTVTYTDEPLEFGSVLKDNFLPSPEEFRRARLEEEQVSVTLSLPKDVVTALKQEAKKRQSDYHSLLQSLISNYTRRNQPSRS